MQIPEQVSKANPRHNQLVRPELLMPAGSLRKLELAYAYGADAVYLGVPFFSLRARENEFDLETLAKALEIRKQLGKKVYVTANIFARNRKISSFEREIEKWAELKPDALIMSDPGLMAIVREKAPDLPIHLSVQSNCMNWRSVKFWKESLGISRVILSRELNINEIKETKDRVPDIELEAFVHGSICIAYSGRCMLSSYMSHRDANQGVCDNSCREKFQVYKTEKVVESDYYLEDLRSPGQMYKIEEDDNGTYIMNAKDLCLIQHLKEITDAGVCSLKVEGRTKSEYYVAMVSRAYSHALDDMMAGRPFNTNLFGELDKVSNRGYSTGFMIQENPGPEAQNYHTGVSRSFNQIFGGFIVEDANTPSGFFACEVRNKIILGQKGEIISQGLDTKPLTIEKIVNQKGESVEVAHGGTGIFYFQSSHKVKTNDVLSIIKTPEEYYRPQKSPSATMLSSEGLT